MQQPKVQEPLVECRVLCKVYKGYDGSYHREGAIIKVPQSWIEKGTLREAGHPEHIIDRPLMPISEERAEAEKKSSAPESTKPFEAEVKRREAWAKMSQTAEEMVKKDQMEVTRRVLESMGGSLPSK